MLKVKCLRGHVFDERNTWSRIRFGRETQVCRRCASIRSLQYYNEKKAKLNNDKAVSGHADGFTGHAGLPQMGDASPSHQDV